MTVDETMTYLSVSRSRVYQLLRLGLLKRQPALPHQSRDPISTMSVWQYSHELHVIKMKAWHLLEKQRKGQGSLEDGPGMTYVRERIPYRGIKHVMREQGYLTTGEAARYLGVTQQTVVQLLMKRKLRT